MNASSKFHLAFLLPLIPTTKNKLAESLSANEDCLRDSIMRYKTGQLNYVFKAWSIEVYNPDCIGTAGVARCRYLCVIEFYLLIREKRSVGVLRSESLYKQHRSKTELSRAPWTDYEEKR